MVVTDNQQISTLKTTKTNKTQIQKSQN